MNLDLQTWFIERNLDFCPKHFVKTKVLVTDTSLEWVYNNLKGRFYIDKSSTDFFSLDNYIYFEDPQEAMMFELRWS